MGVPVIAVGVPTVIDTATLLCDISGEGAVGEEAYGFFVCPKDIDELCEKLSLLVGFAINRAFHGELSIEEMMLL